MYRWQSTWLVLRLFILNWINDCCSRMYWPRFRYVVGDVFQIPTKTTMYGLKNVTCTSALTQPWDSERACSLDYSYLFVTWLCSSGNSRDRMSNGFFKLQRPRYFFPCKIFTGKVNFWSDRSKVSLWTNPTVRCTTYVNHVIKKPDIILTLYPHSMMTLFFTW